MRKPGAAVNYAGGPWNVSSLVCVPLEDPALADVLRTRSLEGKQHPSGHD